MTSRPMRGVYLPGDRRVEIRDVAMPVPGERQLLIRMRASTICGSDLRAIYREHLGTGPEAYREVSAGHEPSGEVIETGAGCREFRPGDRVVVYHISGCGLCQGCRTGYMIGCTSETRAAYGWQRDGGHADFLLADEHTCLRLPEPLTFVDGACVACSFGTAYEALRRAEVSGRDAVLVTGLGPVGLGAGLLARKLGAERIVGVDAEPARLELATRLGAVDVALPAGDDALARILEVTAGQGCEVSIDCSGAASARTLALAGARTWGRAVMVGEGGRLEIDVSPAVIHRQLTVIGSWVTSIGRMQELLDHLVRWDLHPERVVTERLALEDAERAYRIADEGVAGKVGIVMGV